MTKTIFITGTSSGLGKLTALHFAKRGWNVAATMRTPEKESELTAYDNIKIFKLDVTDVQQVQVATEQAIAAFGKIDGVVSGARRSGRNSTYPIVQILRAGSLRKNEEKTMNKVDALLSRAEISETPEGLIGWIWIWP